MVWTSLHTIFRALTSYLKYGFVPLEDKVPLAPHHEQQVSRTLEYAYDDFVLSGVARKVGDTSAAEQLQQRSQWWTNVFDASVGFVRGRHSNGSWAQPFTPSGYYSWLTEANSWQYSWFVPHNVSGLSRLMKNYTSKLQALFSGGQYNHGNEPDHQASYMFMYSETPAGHLTQQRVAQIVRQSYSNSPTGLAGNDDAGQISAWLVWSALGLYPVCPGHPQPYYALGTPLFSRASLGGFTVVAHNISDSNIYVGRAALNGKDYHLGYVLHSEVAAGSTLELWMQDSPSFTWPARPIPF